MKFLTPKFQLTLSFLLYLFTYSKFIHQTLPTRVAEDYYTMKNSTVKLQKASLIVFLYYP